MSWYREKFFPALESRFSKTLAPQKEALLKDCQGKVLEIGFGAGLSLRHYPKAVTSLSAVEPNPGMRTKIEGLEKVAFKVEVAEGVAEKLPYPDGYFDSVVSLLTLCSVRDLSQSIFELHRVLRTRGKMYFIEHTVHPRGLTRKLQQTVQPLWGKIACGCHIDRDTMGELANQGFAITHLEKIGYSGFPDIWSPLYLGIAIRD